MGQISPDYASPGLRLGLLLHDHPDATYHFELKKGTDLGIPAEFGGDGNFCLATIEFGDRRAPASAWKPVPQKGDPELWNTLQTKTLGRALKKAGYPDDLKDLKALLLWRQRGAEIEAITSGTQQLAIASTTTRPQGSLGAGAAASDELEEALDAAASDEGDDAEIEAEIDDRADLVVELVEGLDGRTAANFRAYLSSIKAPEDPHAMTSDQLTDVLAWLDPAGD